MTICADILFNEVQLNRIEKIYILKNIKNIWSDIKQKTDDISKERRSNFIDLFCGIGGFHQVLKSLNKKCVLACDIDKHCRYVYNKKLWYCSTCRYKNIKYRRYTQF